MKKTTTTTRRAARPRVYLNVHPNVIIAHEGRTDAPLFRHVTGSGTMTTGEAALLLAAGFRRQRRPVTLYTFDDHGNPRGEVKG